MEYFIEQKISTTAHNSVNHKTLGSEPYFELDGVKFRHWSYNSRDGWLDDAWSAEATVVAENSADAFGIFYNKLLKIIPRIALVSQCYIQFLRQPYMVHKTDTSVAFLHYIHDAKHVPLMFLDSQFDALSALESDTSIRNEFYKYWNDAVNTIGYSPKLLLMFSALEALVKKPNGRKDTVLLTSILGSNLYETFYAQNTGLRHRLIHGDYFDEAYDSSVDFVETIHEKVQDYFNRKFDMTVMNTNVKHPQRHFFDNKMVGKFFLRPTDPSVTLTLRDLIADFEANNHRATKYEYVHDINPRSY